MTTLITGTVLLACVALAFSDNCYKGESCYKILQNTYTPFGKLMTGVKGIVACKAACSIDPNCGMFDYNVGSTECFSHPPKTVGHDLNIRPGVNQYRKKATCPSNCYVKSPRTYTPNGTKMNCIKGLYNCKRACDQSPHCAAFDFNEDTKECFAHAEGYQSHALPWVSQFKKVTC